MIQDSRIIKKDIKILGFISAIFFIWGLIAVTSYIWGAIIPIKEGGNIYGFVLFGGFVAPILMIGCIFLILILAIIRFLKKFLINIRQNTTKK